MKLSFSIFACWLLGCCLIAVAQSPTPQPQQQGEKWGYVDSFGKFIVPPKYVRAYEFRGGYALVCTHGPFNLFGKGEMGIPLFAKCTFIDQSGNEIRKTFNLENARMFSEGLVAVSTGPIRGGCAKYGYLDTNGRWAVKPRFDAAREFSEGFAAVSVGNSCGLGGKWGYIDRTGKVVVDFQFAYADNFKDGQSCVKKSDNDWVKVKSTANGVLVTPDRCPK
jgi:hypothetical protein